jgi:PA14 domain
MSIEVIRSNRQSSPAKYMKTSCRRTGILLVMGICCCSYLAVAQGSPSTGVKYADTLFGTTTPLPGALHAKVYHLPSGVEKLPEFESLKSVGDLYTYSLQIKPQVYREEYPGPIKRETWFGLDYFGKFWIKQPGTFRFFLRSDDGAKLYIDEIVVIDNDGLHQGGEIKAAQLNLTYGLHRIRIAYFQGPPNSVALELAIRPPGEAIQVFDMRNFSPPSDLGEPSLQLRPQ